MSLLASNQRTDTAKQNLRLDEIGAYEDRFRNNFFTMRPPHKGRWNNVWRM